MNRFIAEEFRRMEHTGTNEFEEVRTDIADLIKRIIEIDKNNENRLKDKMDTVNLEMRFIRRHNEALEGYLGRSDFSGPRFFDKKR